MFEEIRLFVYKIQKSILFLFVLISFVSCFQSKDKKIERYIAGTKDTLFQQSYYFLRQYSSNVEIIPEDIELAVNSCRQALESGEIPFSIFCEYVLPPIVYNEPFENWRKACMEEYDFLKGDSIPNVCDKINHSLSKDFKFGHQSLSPFSMTWSQLKKIKSGHCYHMAKTVLYPLRALGIPVTIDFIHSWGNSTGMHCWNVAYIDGKMVPFMGYESSPYDYNPFLINQSEPDSSKMIFRYPAKVFRKTFSTNPEIEALKKDMAQDDISILLVDSKIKDVSAEYFLVTDITLDNLPEEYANSVVYLSVFSNKWKPVAAAKVKNNKQVVFTAMKREMLYMLSVWKRGTIISLSDPFVIDKDGNKKNITPNFNKTEDFEITTEYLPLKEYLQLSRDKKKSSVHDEENFILSYWNNHGEWQMIGNKKISNGKIRFESVPTNALFYLSDITGKKIGRCFVIENGKQVWW